ncbi:MAG: hypothetical protein LC122_03315 [Chitinophagales bacterium]|nr:hypothetical protein [Chitinophagales bacterium]
MEFILEEVNPDDYFNITIKKDKKGGNREVEPIARSIEIAKIKDSRPTETAIEKKYDEQLDRISRIKIDRKENTSIDFDRMLDNV